MNFKNVKIDATHPKCLAYISMLPMENVTSLPF